MDWRTYHRGAEGVTARIGLGLVSYGRADFRRQAIEAITQHLLPCLSAFTLVADVAPVARAKNMALRALMNADCEWLFLSEDDVYPTSARAVHGYITACEESGLQHLMFHGQDDGLNASPLWVRGRVTGWPNYVGAWGIYHRRAIACCGYFDERFHNAWEHVEHTTRLGQHGHTISGRVAADATGSEHWIAVQPDAIARSVIGTGGPNRVTEGREGKELWRAVQPDTYRLVFGGG